MTTLYRSSLDGFEVEVPDDIASDPDKLRAFVLEARQGLGAPGTAEPTYVSEPSPVMRSDNPPLGNTMDNSRTSNSYVGAKTSALQNLQRTLGISTTPPAPVNLGVTPPGFQDRSRAVAAGQREGFMQPLLGLGQQVGRPLNALGIENPLPTRESIDARRAQEQAGPYFDKPGYGSGKFTGNLVSGLPITAVTKNPFVAGGIFGASMPVGTEDSALSNIAIGTATGLLPYGVNKGLQRLNTPAPGVADLVKRGVNVTPLKARGLGRYEEKMFSLPFIGDAIEDATKMAQRQFNTAAYNEALAPIKQTVKDAGFKGLEAANRAVSKVYKEAEKLIKIVRPEDDSLFKLATVELNDMMQGLPQTVQNNFNRFIKTNYTDRLTDAGTMSSSSWFRQMRDIRNQGFRLIQRGDADQQSLGQAYMAFAKNMTEAAGRVDPQAGVLISQANKSYQNLLPLRRATKMGDDGIFTPGRLRSDARTTGGVLAETGRAPMQRFAQKGQDVLGNTMANSRTFDRAMLGGGLAYGGYQAFANPLATAATGLGLMGLRGLYSQPAMRAMNRSLLNPNRTTPGFKSPLTAMGMTQGLLGQ